MSSSEQREEYGEWFRFPPLYRCHSPEYAYGIGKKMSVRIIEAFESSVSDIYNSGVSSVLSRIPSFLWRGVMTDRPLLAWHLSSEDDDSAFRSKFQKNRLGLSKYFKQQCECGCVMYVRRRLGLDEHKPGGMVVEGDPTLWERPVGF